MHKITIHALSLWRKVPPDELNKTPHVASVHWQLMNKFGITSSKAQNYSQAAIGVIRRQRGGVISEAKCLEAASGSKGSIKIISNRLGCSKSWVHKLTEKYPGFGNAIQKERIGHKHFYPTTRAPTGPRPNAGAKRKLKTLQGDR